MKNKKSLLGLCQNYMHAGQLASWQIALLVYREYYYENGRVGRGDRLYRG